MYTCMHIHIDTYTYTYIFLSIYMYPPPLRRGLAAQRADGLLRFGANFVQGPCARAEKLRAAMK